MRCEDGCTRLMGLSAIRLEGKREVLQCAQFLVPFCDLSLNSNVCSLRLSLKVGYSDEEFPLEERMFLDAWDIDSSKD